MKKFRTVKTIVLELDRVYCNKCGNEIEDPAYGINEFEVSFGYGSSHDGETYSWELCNECVLEFVATFKIKEGVSGFKEI
jgi:hypothetical protein